MNFSVEQKTLERLEWPQLLELWAHHCQTPQARAKLIETDDPGAIFGQTEHAVRGRMAETTEARNLIDCGKAPGLGGIDNELEAAFRRRAAH